MALITERLAGDVTEPVLAQSLHDPPTASGPESPLHQNLQPKPFKFSASGQGQGDRIFLWRRGSESNRRPRLCRPKTVLMKSGTCASSLSLNRSFGHRKAAIDVARFPDSESDFGASLRNGHESALRSRLRTRTVSRARKERWMMYHSLKIKSKKVQRAINELAEKLKLDPVKYEAELARALLEQARSNPTLRSLFEWDDKKAAANTEKMRLQEWANSEDSNSMKH
jgi:hypothetical protein